MSNANSEYKLSPSVIVNLKRLGLRITFARKIQGLRQSDLASMASISRSTLVEIEKGSPYASMGSYMAILWALGIMSDILTTEMTEEDRRLVASELPKRVRHG